MSGLPGADFLVGRVRGVAATVANCGGVDPIRLPEKPLGPPEAAQAENGRFQPGRERRLDRGSQDGVDVSGISKPAAAGLELPSPGSASHPCGRAIDRETSVHTSTAMVGGTRVQR